MIKLDKVYSLVQQSSAKGGIRAKEIGEKLGMHRTTVHRHLTSLDLMGKAESKQGLWVTKTNEQTIKPLEKEIIIELPMPKNKWLDAARLDLHAEMMQDIGFSEIAKMDRKILERFDETRIIKITGKNVDSLDLDKISELVKQATENSYKAKIKKFFRKPKQRQDTSPSG